MQTEIPSDLINVYIAVWFEGFVLIIMLTMLIITFIHNKKKNSNLTRMLILIFFFMTLGIFGSWLAKLIYWSFQVDSIDQVSSTIEYYGIYLYICKYRLTFASISLALYFLYRFKIIVFDAKPNKKEIWIFNSLMLFSLIFILFFTSEKIYDFIAFFLMFILAFLSMGNFAMAAKRVIHKIEDEKYRKAFKSLVRMGALFTMLGVCMLLDRAWIIFGNSTGYTVFYYAGWISTILGTFSAYFGFIRPAKYREQ